jgi:16S rRNA (guanine527-N7)-methyltransferase
VPTASTNISSEEIERVLKQQYGFTATESQIGCISLYLDLLLKWNRTLSLTTITNPGEIVRRHFGESIFATKLLAVENCRLVDIGTGAGFPGLALKIAFPSMHLSLIESNKKKCVFLSEVLRSLKISDVQVVAERFEDVRPETMETNLITSRAVGGYEQMLNWAKRALARRGHIMLWVGAEDSTRISANSEWIWQPAVRIPESQRRFILIGRIRESPAR